MCFDFGYRLKELRISKKITQTKVAYLLNLSKTTISGYENNIKTPSVDVLIKLAMLYGGSTGERLGLEGKEVVFVKGLTSKQKEIVQALIDEFKNMK